MVDFSGLMGEKVFGKDRHHQNPNTPPDVVIGVVVGVYIEKSTGIIGNKSKVVVVIKEEFGTLAESELKYVHIIRDTSEQKPL